MSTNKELIIISIGLRFYPGFSEYKILFKNKVVYQTIFRTGAWELAAGDMIACMRDFIDIPDYWNNIYVTTGSYPEWYIGIIQNDLRPDNVHFTTLGGTYINPQG
jgi:hypothetical protein